ncbi:hypothetical protein [Uliginosibacterium sediminicola]|uniref:NnrS family protein n=1 Tax=Uliginosibacterium sediminicola TaxID=2024550 RepID=A0ABU9YT40_9RHOO
MRVPLRLLLALPAFAALLCGVLSGLARLGLPVGAAFAQLIGAHGALMTGAFFGTLIGLERAVALGRQWPYLAPLCSGLAGLVLIAQGAVLIAALLMSAAAGVLCIACCGLWRRQRVAHLATLGAAALCWLIGNLAWALSDSFLFVVPLWAAFLILTIAAERLELSRLVPTPPRARQVFGAIVAGLMLSATLAAWPDAQLDLALRIFAASMLALAVWLLRYDIARRTLHTPGLTRYMAICLLSAYAWLALAGVLGLFGALQLGQPLRDAALHALLLGFVFAMVFGHAPVILPALSRLRMRWHAGLYLPLAFLHLSLLLRLSAGLSGNFSLRQDAAIGNALALLSFGLGVIACLYAGRVRPPN